MIKKALRKWLGIEDPLQNRKLIETLIKDTLYDALQEEPSNNFALRFKSKLANIIEDSCERLSIEHVKDISRSAAYQYVRSEEFIDEIVERIQRKQLPK